MRLWRLVTNALRTTRSTFGGWPEVYLSNSPLPLLSLVRYPRNPRFFLTFVSFRVFRGPKYFKWGFRQAAAFAKATARQGKPVVRDRPEVYLPSSGKDSSELTRRGEQPSHYSRDVSCMCLAPTARLQLKAWGIAPGISGMDSSAESAIQCRWV